MRPHLVGPRLVAMVLEISDAMATLFPRGLPDQVLLSLTHPELRRARKSVPADTLTASEPSDARQTITAPPNPKRRLEELFAMIDDLADLAAAAFIKGALKPHAGRGEQPRLPTIPPEGNQP